MAGYVQVPDVLAVQSQQCFLFAAQLSVVCFESRHCAVEALALVLQQGEFLGLRLENLVLEGAEPIMGLLTEPQPGAFIG